jgi:hypothetical protein
MNNTKLDNMRGMNCLLTSLSPEVVDYDKTTEKEIISELIQEYKDANGIKNILAEGREVLTMNPFPWEWVQSISQTLVYDEVSQKWVEDPILYHQWLEKVLNTLEAEAKKQGKLD